MKYLLLIFFLFFTVVQAKIYKIGFAQDTLKNDWRLAQANELKKEALKYSFLSLDIKSAETKVAKQISDIEYFIDNNYDFIITSPINAKITSLVLKKALNKNIKVILIDRGITTNDYTSFISPDNYQIAQKAAVFMTKKINTGVILMLEGINGATVTNERSKGFMDVIKKYPKIKVIKRRANFLRQDAIKVMDKIYEDDIPFDAIYSHSDSMLSGVRKVMKIRNKNRAILQVGIDYISEAKDAIENGFQTASFTYHTGGKEAIGIILDLINNRAIKKNITINSIMVTKENVNLIKPIF